MSTSNGIITKPVSIKDVQQTIGNASGDLGTLCKSSTINKWSKHKPISSSILFDTSDSFYKVNNYGLSIPTFSNTGNLATTNTLVNYLANNDTAWTYNKPTGGPNSPYRLGDFLNYYHGALNPIGSIGATDFYYDGNAVVINYGENPEVDVGNQYNIMLKDLQVNGIDTSTCYYGLMLYTYSEYHLYTTNNTIGNGPITFNITDIKPSTAKSYTAALFISSVMITGTAQSATYIPYEHDKDLIVIHPLSDLFRIEGTGVFTDTSNIDATITITNNKNISMTVTDIKYSILRSRSPKPSAGDEVVMSGKKENQTVAAHSQLDISFTLQCGYVTGYNYFFKCQASGFETTYGYIGAPISEPGDGERP